MTDKDFLYWIAARLTNVYNEPSNVDFVIKLREITDKLPVENSMRYPSLEELHEKVEEAYWEGYSAGGNNSSS